MDMAAMAHLHSSRYAVALALSRAGRQRVLVGGTVYYVLRACPTGLVKRISRVAAFERPAVKLYYCVHTRVCAEFTPTSKWRSTRVPGD
eukprot:scaffold243949_cov36-Tisochrysis_lutea.AAC.5